MPRYGAMVPPVPAGAPPVAGGESGTAGVAGSGPYAVRGLPTEAYASWARRVAASLLDDLLILPFMLMIFGGITVGVAAVDPATNAVNSGSAALGLVMVTAGWLGVVVVQIWNRVFRQGRTGQSWGKTIIGVRLVGERTGEPIGPAMAFVRDVLHVVDAILYLGYLWPLWDDERQTFSDKICRTVVMARAD